MNVKDGPGKQFVDKGKLDGIKALYKEIEGLYMALGRAEEDYQASKKSLLAQVAAKKGLITVVVRGLGGDGRPISNINLETGEIEYKQDDGQAGGRKDAQPGTS